MQVQSEVAYDVIDDADLSPDQVASLIMDMLDKLIAEIILFPKGPRLVLALVMAFSFVTVIGNAALVKSEVAYDVIDDADLSPEQVASIIMDLLDKLIAEIFIQNSNFLYAI